MAKRRHEELQAPLDGEGTGDHDAAWSPFGSAAPSGKRRKTGDGDAPLGATIMALEAAVAEALSSASATADKATTALNTALMRLLTAQLTTNASADLSAAARLYLQLRQQINAKFTATSDASAVSALPPLKFMFRPPQSTPPAFGFGFPQPATSTSGFSFGSAASVTSAATPVSPSSFSFGMPFSASPSAFGSTASTLGFGASSSPSSAAVVSSPVSAPTFSFGGSRPSSPTGFPFGVFTKPPSPRVMSAQPATPVAFGQPATSFGATRPSSPPPNSIFGAPASPSPTADSKPGASFGGATSQKPSPPVGDPTESALQKPFSGFLAAPNTTFSVWSEPELLRHRVLQSDITPLKQISTGGFGDVWLSEFQGRRVAVKSLASADQQTKATSVVLATEVKLMAELRHPRITAFVGVEWTKEWAAQALSEYEELGDLRTMVETETATGHGSSSRGFCSGFGWADFKCQAAIDVADALTYLHTRSVPVIMEVVRARNVLVCDMDGHCKLSVFAAARCRSVSDNLTSRMATTPWLAPEIILDTGSKSDRSVVYSLGALLCELDSGMDPLADARNPDGSVMSSFKVAQQVSQGKLTPRVTAECPVAIAELASECLSFDALKRPTVVSVAYRLREILKGEL